MPRAFGGKSSILEKQTSEPIQHQHCALPGSCSNVPFLTAHTVKVAREHVTVPDFTICLRPTPFAFKYLPFFVAPIFILPCGAYTCFDFFFTFRFKKLRKQTKKCGSNETKKKTRIGRIFTRKSFPHTNTDVPDGCSIKFDCGQPNLKWAFPKCESRTRSLPRAALAWFTLQ